MRRGIEPPDGCGAPVKIPGDKAINRAAQAGATTYLFGGRKYELSRDQVYGTKLDRRTGQRTIVKLLLPPDECARALKAYRERLHGSPPSV